VSAGGLQPLLIALLVGAASVGGAPAAHAQVFIASRPEPGFAIGPLTVRANVAEPPSRFIGEGLW
jgi:hypothetical protein